MPSAVVVGAGLSGLIAARELVRAHWTVTVIEARDRIGGRIQTDLVDGFLLDHGFQVYLTGYKTASEQLDLASLQLGVFTAGALVQFQGKRHRVSDPLRSEWYKAPMHALQTLLAPVGSLSDKLRMATFKQRVGQCDPSSLLKINNVSAQERLEQMGFSEVIIDRFFRPFFGGIFLDDSLNVSAGMMEFVFQTFSNGFAALPAEGMQAIPRQITTELPSDSIWLNKTVAEVSAGKVIISDGQVVSADHVIVATEEPTAIRLLAGETNNAGQSMTDLPRLKTPSTSCLYFEVIDPPIHEATLLLNGDGEGVINNLCFPNFAQPSYAPAGKSLLSVSTIDHTESTGESLLLSVRQQLFDWFGKCAATWRHLRTYRVPYALPNQSPRALTWSDTKTQVAERIWRCGDYCETGSIEGAIQSGLKTSREILKTSQSSNH